MPWFPGAVKKVVSRHQTPMASYRAIILHVAASEADSLYGYFDVSGRPTSHFYVQYDGGVEQYVDTKYRAPAQLDGNPTCIGIETQGMGSGTWTDKQMDSLVALCVWLHETHGIPLTFMPDSKPTSKGIAPHRWGVNPYRVSGGELWSNSYAKSCPGNDRMQQVPIVVDRALEETLALSAEDKEWFKTFSVSLAQHIVAATVRALADGSTNNAGYINTAAEPFKSILAAYSLKAVKGAQSGGVDLAAVAKAVADELSRRTAQ